MASQRTVLTLARSLRLKSPAALSQRAFTLSARTLAKGDDSTIDFYKLPPSNYVPTEVGPSIKIPILPDNYNATVNEVKPTKGKYTAEFNKPLLEYVSAHGTASNMTDADILATTGAGGPSEGASLPESPDQLEKLSDKDASVLMIIAGLIAGWWILGNAIEKRSANKH